MFADPYSIVVTCRKRFSQLLHYMRLMIVRQIEMDPAEPLVTEPSAFEVELAIKNLKSHKSPGIYQILVELTKAEEEKFTKRSPNLIVLFGIKRNCLRSGRIRSLYLSIRRAINRL